MAEIMELNEKSFDEQIMKSDKVALVDFWAPWCGPCRMLHPIIEALAGEYDGKAVIARCNVDENTELAGRYSVTAIPTLIFFKGGEQIETMIGVNPPEAIKKVLDSNL